jgi:hypothetical protein
MTGFPRSARPSYIRCRAPPLPRSRGALLAGVPTPASTAASQRLALNPRNPSIARAPLYEALSRGSQCSPFRTSPHLSPADGSPALGLPPGASHPTAQTVRDACRERGRASSTHPELTASHMALQSVSSLETCDLVSQRQKRTFPSPGSHAWSYSSESDSVPQHAGVGRLRGTRGCPEPSGLRILIGSSPERTGSSVREIPEIHS